MRAPRALGAYGMTVVLSLFGASGLVRACTTTATTNPLTTTNDVMGVAKQCTDMVNAERAKVGAKPVSLELHVQNASQKHSNYQASKLTMTHSEPAPRTDAGARITAEGYKWSTWGENVAAGQANCTQVMSAWMASSGHRANILNKAFSHIGMSARKGTNGVIYWTMDLSTPG